MQSYITISPVAGTSHLIWDKWLENNFDPPGNLTIKLGIKIYSAGAVGMNRGFNNEIQTMVLLLDCILEYQAHA